MQRSKVKYSYFGLREYKNQKTIPYDSLLLLNMSSLYKTQLVFQFQSHRQPPVHYCVQK